MRRPERWARASAAAICIWCGLLIAAAAPVAAQEVAPEDRARLEALFNEVARDPTNLDLTYEYAITAANAGDYEAAITAYERLLLFNPDLPRVKAELGVMYFKLGSLDVAKAYLEDALEQGDPPPEVKARIERFLAAIDKNTQRHRYSGSVAFGARFQTNANFGPDGQILVFDFLADPGEEVAEDEDINFFAAARARYVYDFGNDAGDFFSVNANLYGSRQIEFTELDVEHLFIDAGPAFNIFPTESGPLRFRPSLRMTYVQLNDESYNFSPGLGFRFDWSVADDVAVFGEAFGELREYYSTEDRVNAATQDGAAFRMKSGASYLVTPETALRAAVTIGRVLADEGSEAFSQLGFEVGASHTFDSPFAESQDVTWLSRPWNASLNLSYMRRDHEQANNLVSALVRQDDDYRIDSTLAVPVAPEWSVFANLGYQMNESNILNNEFDNFTFALGANWRF